jgi:arylsulfatase
VLFYANTSLRAVKYRDWKFHYLFQAEPGAAPAGTAMRLFNLLSDPKEESDIKDANPWVKSITDRLVAEFVATTTKYPHVPPNAPDPYTPPVKRP